jgi:hypothetical protein
MPEAHHPKSPEVGACAHCHETKPAGEFGRDYCRPCMSMLFREYRARHHGRPGETTTPAFAYAKAHRHIVYVAGILNKVVIERRRAIEASPIAIQAMRVS